MILSLNDSVISKGHAVPARAGWRVRARIENHARANRENKGTLIELGGPALQRAFDAEQASMHQYIEDHFPRRRIPLASKLGRA